MSDPPAKPLGVEHHKKLMENIADSIGPKVVEEPVPTKVEKDLHINSEHDTLTVAKKEQE